MLADDLVKALLLVQLMHEVPPILKDKIMFELMTLLKFKLTPEEMTALQQWMNPQMVNPVQHSHGMIHIRGEERPSPPPQFSRSVGEINVHASNVNDMITGMLNQLIDVLTETESHLQTHKILTNAEMDTFSLARSRLAELSDTIAEKK